MARMFVELFPDAEMKPIIKTPDDLLIVVVGGFGRHSCWLPTFGDTTRAVTKLIARADGAAARRTNVYPAWGILCAALGLRHSLLLAGSDSV